jgi:uncharacterized protein YceK
MRKIFLSFLVAAPLVLAGCSSITNLTPSKYTRNATGLYPVEAAWTSEERTIRQQSFKPLVMAGGETYEMRRVPLVQDRWETMIPIPADKDSVYYRFKFDYLVNKLNHTEPDSKLSPEYKLQIIDKK